MNRHSIWRRGHKSIAQKARRPQVNRSKRLRCALLALSGKLSTLGGLVRPPPIGPHQASPKSPMTPSSSQDLGEGVSGPLHLDQRAARLAALPPGGGGAPRPRPLPGARLFRFQQSCLFALTSFTLGIPSTYVGRRPSSGTRCWLLASATRAKHSSPVVPLA
jgi:hypothetical protein